MSNQTHLLVLAPLEFPECRNTKNFVKTVYVNKWVMFTLYGLFSLLLILEWHEANTSSFFIKEENSFLGAAFRFFLFYTTGDRIMRIKFLCCGVGFL